MLMKEPVTAEDNFNYEQAAIRRWLERSKKSPQTKEVIGMRLEMNVELKAAIEGFKSFANGVEEEISLAWGEREVKLSREDVRESGELQMCQALSKFFKELDPLQDLLRETLNGLKAPKVKVMGDESAGKSTILEMLAMIPLFPRKRRSCTRLAIHLRLRRTPGVSRVWLSVASADDESKEFSMEIPQENGWSMVQEVMEGLQERSKRKRFTIRSQINQCAHLICL